MNYLFECAEWPWDTVREFADRLSIITKDMDQEASDPVEHLSRLQVIEEMDLH